MKHLAAYILLILGGNPSPTVEDIRRVLDAAGASHCETQEALVIREFNGKNLNELISVGKIKMTELASQPRATPPPVQREHGKE